MKAKLIFIGKIQEIYKKLTVFILLNKKLTNKQDFMLFFIYFFRIFSLTKRFVISVSQELLAGRYTANVYRGLQTLYGEICVQGFLNCRVYMFVCIQHKQVCLLWFLRVNYKSKICIQYSTDNVDFTNKSYKETRQETQYCIDFPKISINLIRICGDFPVNSKVKTCNACYFFPKYTFYGENICSA